jgi:hypothetical protein
MHITMASDLISQIKIAAPSLGRRKIYVIEFSRKIPYMTRNLATTRKLPSGNWRGPGPAEGSICRRDLRQIQGRRGIGARPRAAHRPGRNPPGLICAASCSHSAARHSATNNPFHDCTGLRLSASQHSAIRPRPPIFRKFLRLTTYISEIGSS